jgi:hypothetical protein
MSRKKSSPALYESLCLVELAKYHLDHNPLHAWQALRIWLRAGHDNRFDLPHVLREFLDQNSADLLDLALGDLAPGMALAKLPEAMRLRVGKWDAFSEYRRDLRAQEMRERFQDIRESGVSYKDASEELANRLGVSEEREIRRKMSGKRRGPERPPPPPAWRKGAK